MPPALRDMAALRQRVLESLTKRNSVMSLKEPNDLEEGEILDTVDQATVVQPLPIESNAYKVSAIIAKTPTVVKHNTQIPGKPYLGPRSTELILARS